MVCIWKQFFYKTHTIYLSKCVTIYAYKTLKVNMLRCACEIDKCIYYIFNCTRYIAQVSYYKYMCHISKCKR